VQEFAEDELGGRQLAHRLSADFINWRYGRILALRSWRVGSVRAN
jgi:hypothetical protein